MQFRPDTAEPIRLRTLFPGAQFHGADDVLVARCTSESSRVERGSLFVALQSPDRDGHDSIPEALARGCSAILTQRPVHGLLVPVCTVPDTQTAYGQLCQALAGNPSQHVKVIGITGTQGKTTTSCLVASILKAAGRRVGLLGTLGCCDGRKVTRTAETTPPADELAAALARMVRNDCSHAVIEVSSVALDQSRVAGIGFDAACVTNVRRDHLDYHRSLHNYRSAKARLLDHLSDVGFAVLNADDSIAMSYAGRIDGPVLTIGMNAGLADLDGDRPRGGQRISAPEITATLIERAVSEQTMLLSAGGETIPVRTRMIGVHHAYNCLIAAAVGLAYEIDLPTIARGLEAVDFVPGRLERIECGQPFGVFVDNARTPDGLTGSLQTLREVVAGRLICVFGAGGDCDPGKRSLIGRAVENGADAVVITNEQAQSEHPLSVLQDVLSAMRHPHEAEVIPDRREAIAWAVGLAQPGDCVLVAGKGHTTEPSSGRRRIPLDDREVARQWLYENQPTGSAPQSVGV
jgi:UDP-N-acetylmuramoyl-L-alanyl-D-glutamate--2,6-diaminopimelate ligase